MAIIIVVSENSDEETTGSFVYKLMGRIFLLICFHSRHGKIAD